MILVIASRPQQLSAFERRLLYELQLLHNPQTRMMPRDILRIIRSGSGNSSAFENAWKDF